MSAPPAAPGPVVPRPLLAIKVHVPQGRRRLVEREDLVDRLVQGQSGRLTVVSAPAGWGKTTLLLQWRRRTAGHARFGWVMLDEDDADPSMFWAYVVEALSAMFPDRTAEARRLAGLARIDIRRTLLPSLLNALEGGTDRGVLVLDDYHLVRSPPVQEQLAYFVEHLPASLHLALVTRSEPGFPLARLRERGELTELNAADLRFSAAETGTLLTDVLGLRLGPADLRTLHRRTEGWAAALQLAALSLRTSRDPAKAIDWFSGEHEHLVQYLGSEVLAGLDPQLRAWLTRTAVLDRLCAPLCDAVTGRGDAVEMLHRAEQANLFLLSLDDRHEWFRYHHLFAGVLRRELARSDPAMLPTLHRRASAWYATQGSPSEAVRHALQAGDRETAHRLVGRHWNHEYNAGRFTTVSGWLDGLGAQRVRHDPWLSSARVMIWADEGRLEELDAWLEVDPPVDGYPYAVLRALHRFKSGDLGRAREELDRAAPLRSESEPFWPTVEHCVRGATTYWSGDPATAKTSLATAATLARSYDNAAGHTYATGYLALAALDEDDEVTARRRLTQVAGHLDPKADLATHFVLALPLLVQGRLLARDENPAEARVVLERAVAAAGSGAGRLERVATAVALGRVLEQLGERAAAARHLAESTALLRASPDAGRAGALLADEPSAPRVQLAASGQSLTAREAAVLRLLPSQRSLREIADTLYVSHNTVKTHTRTLYRKLAVSTREEAVAAARENGLL
ncbi:MAG TPA: LuxR C-terminal-related transcriptional regulator [Actinomycetes bacterium]